MIIRRSLVLLLLEELREGRLLIVAALEKKRDARGGLRVGYGAAIEFGASEAMDVAAKRDAIGVVNRLRDARGDSRRLRKLCGVALHARRWRSRGGLLRLRGNAQCRERQQKCGANYGSTQIGPDVLHESAHDLDYFSFLTWISLSLRSVLTASSAAFSREKMLWQ